MSALNFVALDFETANAFRGSPCSLGLVTVKDGRIVEERQFLCRPPGVNGPEDFDPFNISLHGITFEMVKDEPGFADIWANIYPSIGELPLVAHNAGFDIGVIRDALDYESAPWTPFQYTCSLVLSRRVLDLPSYGLAFVADELEVELHDHHDSLSDARACAEITSKLCQRSEVDDLNTLLDKHRIQWGRLTVDDWRGSRAKAQKSVLPAPRLEASTDHFLYGQNVVISGTLPYGITKAMAWERIAYYGGIAQENVTKKTTLLVVGELDPARLARGSEISGKMKKAFEFREKGQPIEVLAGSDFMSYLD
jgi:DNA polymerase-3 subunit epsilon